MQWMYRLQQRFALTRGEARVLLVLAFLFGLGLAARYLQSRAHPLPEAAHAEAGLLFQQASDAPPADAPAGETDAQALLAPAAGAAPSSPTYASKPAPAASINLNTATTSELQRLPRIGPTMAARIIAYREAHGPFRRVQDLVQVRGIGKKTLARLTPYLVVDAEAGN